MGEGDEIERPSLWQALLVPDSSFLKLSMKASPWALSEDGRLHTYTLILALCVDSLPSTSLPIFNGGPPPPQGEKVENLQLFKNGGVGALNDMGTQARLVWLLRYSLMGVNMVMVALGAW